MVFRSKTPEQCHNWRQLLVMHKRIIKILTPLLQNEDYRLLKEQKKNKYNAIEVHMSNLNAVLWWFSIMILSYYLVGGNIVKNPGISNTTKYPSLKVGTSHGGLWLLNWCVEITVVWPEDTVSFLTQCKFCILIQKL